jgi:hypothetical protein
MVGGAGGPDLPIHKRLGAPGLAFWRHGIRDTRPSDLGDRPTLDIPIPGLKVQTLRQAQGRPWGTQSFLASLAWATRRRHAALAAFAVNSIPRAFITASVVLSVGLPFSLNDR